MPCIEGKKTNVNLQDITCFLLDMDGTVYLDSEWIDGALDFLRRIEERGKRYCFLTNNSSRDAESYVKKLSDMGLVIDAKKQLVTSGQATIDFLSHQYPGKSIFLLGNDALKREFIGAGIRLENRNPDIVVTAFDTTLNYEKMRTVCDFVRAGLPFIATHPDYNCPTKDGFMPDVGAIHAFIQVSAGRQPDVIIGKPNHYIMDYALSITGSERAQTAMVGDRLYTDIESAFNSGLTGILVLSGETTKNDLLQHKQQPHYVFSSVAEMIDRI